MNNIYFQIFHNSLQSHFFIVSLISENAWFAARQFGGHNMVLATLAALAGSLLGLSITYGIGYYASRWREKLPIYSEETYQSVSRLFNRTLYKIMVIPPILLLEFIPGFSLFVLVNGLMRVSPKKAPDGAAYFPHAVLYLLSFKLIFFICWELRMPQFEIKTRDLMHYVEITLEE